MLRLTSSERAILLVILYAVIFREKYTEITEIFGKYLFRNPHNSRRMFERLENLN